MNVLLIFAHPNPQSLNAAVAERLTSGFRHAGHDVQCIDLYREQFNPALVFHADKPRRQLRHDPETARYREMVQWAQHLVFVYPVWWSGFPAILKGFFDKVFVSGFAYRNSSGLRSGLLPHKSAWSVCTMDAPHWFYRFFRLNLDGFMLKHAILRYCGIRHVGRFVFARVHHSTAGKREKWLQNMYDRASGFRHKS